MKPIAFLLLAVLFMAFPSFAQPSGESVFLGRLSAIRYAPDSTSNPYGHYGSPYSATSINNPYSPYGSAFSITNPNNPFATKAPILSGGK